MIMFFKLALTLFCSTAFASFAFTAPKSTDVKTYENMHGRPLKVVYYSHNNANIKEFLRGRDTVNEILSKISMAGFQPKIDYLEVAISPLEMVNGHVVIEGKNIFISITATHENIERQLLNFFKFKREHSRLIYFPHNNPILHEFFLGKEAIDRVIDRFSENNLSLDVEYLEIGISPVEMMDGNVIERDGKLYVSLQATEDQIERYFMKYVRY